MTDADALKQIDDILAAHATCSGCHTCRMLRHNRLAITDRAAIAGDEDPRLDHLPSKTYGAVDFDLIRAARRHMRGEP